MALLASEETRQPVQTTQAPEQAAQPAQQTQAQQAQQTPKVETAPAPKTTTAPKVQSSSYDKAMKTLQAAQNQTPTFSSDYDQTISDLYQQISNRQPFQYDAASDPLYQQYREQYMQGGQQAMRDTMGQAAALTGGYGSSYGQAVGQQQYDAYLQRLNDVLPDLYKTAYDQYNAEGDRLTQRMQLAGQLRENEYGQFRDAVADKQYADAFAIQEAESRAQYGDFSGYEAIYGADAVKPMKYSWAAQNPQLAYQMGNITKDQYDNLTHGYPIDEGLDENGVRTGAAPWAGSGGGGGGDPWAYGGSGWNGGNYYLENGIQHDYYNPGGDYLPRGSF